MIQITILILLIVVLIYLYCSIYSDANKDEREHIRVMLESGKIITCKDAYKLIQSGEGCIHYRTRKPFQKILLFYDLPNVTEYYENIDSGSGVTMYGSDRKDIMSERFQKQYPDIDVSEFIDSEGRDFCLIGNKIGGDEQFSLIFVDEYMSKLDNNEFKQRHNTAEPFLIVDEDNNLVSIEDFKQQYPDVNIVTDKSSFNMVY